MPVLKPTVSSKGIDRETCRQLVQEIANLGDGEFSSDGVQYDDRSKANAMAAKYLRVIESMFSNLTLRSRTWEGEEGGWYFGLREKDQGPSEHSVKVPPAPEPVAPEKLASRGRSSK